MYNTLTRLEGGAFSLAQGTDTGAETYATAMLLAQAAQTQERAANNRDPLQALELLPVREKDWKGISLATDSLTTRRLAQAAREKRSAGGTRAAIEAALSALLGSDFIAYRPVSATERTLFPTDPTTSGIFSRPDIPPTVFTLPNRVDMTGVPITFRYVDVPITPYLYQPIVIDAGNRSQREVVLVNGFILGLGFNLIFAKSHEPGAVCTIGPYPAWSSTKRHSYIVVSTACALDPSRRRLISQTMNRIARGVSTWSIVREPTPGTLGPFTVGTSAIGIDPIGSVTV